MATDQSVIDTSFHSSSTLRWVGALILGGILWFAATFASQLVPQVILGLPMTGITFAFVGIIQAILVPSVIALVLRFVSLRLRDIGPISSKGFNDALVGVAIALVFALLQFLVIIPNTGEAMSLSSAHKLEIHFGVSSGL